MDHDISFDIDLHGDKQLCNKGCHFESVHSAEQETLRLLIGNTITFSNLV